MILTRKTPDGTAADQLIANTLHAAHRTAIRLTTLTLLIALPVIAAALGLAIAGILHYYGQHWPALPAVAIGTPMIYLLLTLPRRITTRTRATINETLSTTDHAWALNLRSFRELDALPDPTGDPLKLDALRTRGDLSPEADHTPA